MLDVVDVTKTYEGQPLLKGVSFTVGASETVCLLGPSGSGKSTLLLMIAGLELPDAGQIRWDGADLASVPAHLRDFGLVFQDYALFPHMNVFENIAYGLKTKHWDSEAIRPRVSEVLNLVDLDGFDRRRVTDLSGGEQQRVALARALAPRPRLLMFDEPLGALDRSLRESLLEQLRGILQETRLPAIYVTHDQDEASTIADRVLLLHEGQIVRQGAVPDVWASPGSAWAARFLGLGTVLQGQIHGRGQTVKTAYGSLRLRCDHRHKAGESVQSLIRPVPAEHGSTARGRVSDVVFQQDRYRVTLEGGLFIYLPLAPKVGQRLTVKVQPECLE